MTFLAPAALIGILLLAVPILAHLFKPRKMRLTPFSSLRWLKETQQRLSRRIQWHQWLLFLMRAGFITLLVLALAKPLIGLSGGDGPRDRLLIVDVGRSMGYDTPGQPTPLDRAKHLAGRYLEHARPGERTALVLGGGRPRLAATLTSDTTVHQAVLRVLETEEADLPISSTLPIARALLQAHEDHRDLEILVVTDNRQAGWRQADVQTLAAELAASARVTIVDVGVPAATNAWIAGARLLERADAKERVIRVEIGHAGATARERTVRLTGAGLADDGQTVVLPPGQMARVDFTIPGGADLTGQVAEARLEPADGLPGDDRYFLNLDVPWALRVLVVAPAAPEPEARGVDLFIRAGLEALGESKNHALALTRRTAQDAAAADFQKADVIFLAGVPELSEPAMQSLEKRVRGGAGLVVFLGRTVNATFYNEKFYKALQPVEGLLGMPLPTGSGAILQGKPGLLTQVRWQHPMLAPLHDPVLGDLTLGRFHSYLPFSQKPGSADVVLACIDEVVPALVERSVGVGRVFLWNASADDSWCDLPRSRAFVPLLDGMVGYLSGGGVRRQFTVGDRATLPLTDLQAGESVHVKTPQGKKVTPRMLTAGGQTLLHLEELTEAGVYRVERKDRPDKGFVFAVNTGRQRSLLTPMDAQTLASWWTPAACAVTTDDDFEETLKDQTSGWPVWPALIFLAGLLLLAEMIYVHRLCPRLNPSVVESVVPQRGLLKPLRQESPL